MTRLITLTVLFMALLSCKTYPESIPLGTWKYDILVNNARVGHATVTTAARGNNYVSTTEMTMKAGSIVNTTLQTIVETRDFKPVSLETRNRIIHNGAAENIDTSATFSNGRASSTITIDRPFVLDGAIYAHELIRNEFRTGTEISFSVYEPSIETEEPISVKMNVIGPVTVVTGGEEETLIHVTETIAGIKNIDLYVDQQGITRRAVITMLNNRLELIMK
jgi:hypothetical protein